MIKKNIRKIQNFPGEVVANLFVSKLKDGDYLIGDVPYQCQFATPELANDILEGRMSAKDDPNWKVLGFKTREESEYWAWRNCGICCVKMVIDFYGKNDSYSSLTEKGVALGGYDIDKDLGWYYKPLLKLLKSFSVKGFISPQTSVSRLAHLIHQKKFVIASVNPSIIRLDKLEKTKEKSGHLVLVTGFSKKVGKISGFYINNPSGKIVETQKQAFIPIDVFIRAYGGRGIVVSDN